MTLPRVQGYADREELFRKDKTAAMDASAAVVSLAELQNCEDASPGCWLFAFVKVWSCAKR